MHRLTEISRRRLDIQGFDSVDDQVLAGVAPWLRLAFGLCALIAGIGTVLASPTILMLMVPVAGSAALFPVHPFDLIYNHGIRRFTGTGPLPRRGAPSRFACGLGAVWLLPTAWAFQTRRLATGYVLGGAVTLIAVLVSTTDICIPSLVFRLAFGLPPRRATAPPPSDLHPPQ